MDRSIQEKVQAQYSRQAGLYSVSKAHATGESLARLLDLAQLTGKERVLDVATGTGFCALAFAPHVREVVACDLTPAMLAEASKLAAGRGVRNMILREGAAEEMPFDEGEFDIVTCRVAPHHFASVPRFLAESRRVLRPGGKLLIADTAASDDREVDRWENEVEKLRDPSHVRDYTASEWRAFVLEAGFSEPEIAMTCWTSLTFNDWVRRSGTPEDTTAHLRGLFNEASPRIVRALKLQAVDDDFAWEWPVVCIRAYKRG